MNTSHSSMRSLYCGSRQRSNCSDQISSSSIVIASVSWVALGCARASSCVQVRHFLTSNATCTHTGTNKVVIRLLEHLAILPCLVSLPRLVAKGFLITACSVLENKLSSKLDENGSGIFTSNHVISLCPFCNTKLMLKSIYTPQSLKFGCRGTLRAR